MLIISNHLKSSQIISNHLKSSQIISNHLKSSQIISNHLKSSHLKRLSFFEIPIRPLLGVISTGIMFLLNVSLVFSQVNICNTPDLTPTEYGIYQQRAIEGQGFRSRNFSQTTQEVPVYFTVTRQSNGNNSTAPIADQAFINSMILNLNQNYVNAGLHFYQLGMINYIDNDVINGSSGIFGGASTSKYSSSSAALNFIIDNSATAFGTQPTDNPPNNYAILGKDRIIATPTLPTHEIGHVYGLLHTHGPTTIYNNPVGGPPSSQIDYPYGSFFPRELQIRPGDPNLSSKIFQTPNCDGDISPDKKGAGDLCCDTRPACANYQEFFPNYNSMNCPYSGTYLDYNNDPITPEVNNLMGYYNCPNSFTNCQLDRIAYYSSTQRKFDFNPNYAIDLNDFIEFEGTSNPLFSDKDMSRPIVVSVNWDFVGSNADFRSVTIGKTGQIQATLFQTQVKAEVKTFGNGSLISLPCDVPQPGCYINSDTYSYDDWIGANTSYEITSQDLVKISNHILWIKPLSSGYCMLAADANHGGTITNFDITELRRLLNGTYKALPAYTQPWRFVPEFIAADYATQFNTNPFNMTVNGSSLIGAPYTEPSYVYSNTGTNGKSGYDAVKIGNISCSLSQFEVDKLPRLTNIPSANLQSGRTYEMTIRASSGFSNITSFQLGFFIDYSKINITSIVSSDLTDINISESCGITRLADNEFRVVWYQENGNNGVTLTGNNKGLFKIRFTALENISDLSSVFRLSSDVLKSYFFTENGVGSKVDLVPVIQEGAQDHSDTNSEFKVSDNLQVSCIPNPFVHSFSLNIDSPKEEAQSVIISDFLGRICLTKRINVLRGKNTIILDDLGGVPSGALSIQVVGTTSKTIRVIKN